MLYNIVDGDELVTNALVHVNTNKDTQKTQLTISVICEHSIWSYGTYIYSSC